MEKTCLSRAAVVAVTLLAALLGPLSLSAPAAAEAGGGVPGPQRLDASAIALGYEFGCVVVSGGAVRCWGDNFAGQLGQGNTANVGDDPGESTAVVPLERPAVAITAGDSFACAILDTGEVRCWGDNAYGQLAQGNTANVGDTPGETTVPISLSRPAVAVAAGSSHACAILDTGEVRCWGYNGEGELGQGNTGYVGDGPGETTVPVVLPRPATAVAAADYSTCAVLDTGQLRCWGGNSSGELMQGNENDIGNDPGESTVAVVTNGLAVLAISGGTSHYCAIYADHTLHCWGHSGLGSLGLGRTDNFGDDPGETNVGHTDLGGSLAVAVGAGRYHTCAVLDTGGLRCWGNNSQGELGQGGNATVGNDPGEYTVPVDLPGPVQSVVGGSGFTCAVNPTGLRCWGDASSGQLARGSSTDYGAAPGELPHLLPAIDLGGQLVGRDSDGDGVRDAVDACPTVAGILANGCRPEALLKGKKVVLDTVLTKTKASAKCPAKATVKVKTKSKLGKLTVTKQLKTKTVATGCAVKGKVKLSAKPKKSAKTKVTITGTKLKTKRLVAVKL
jgi:alpha-tubulin suppressor-like RCC1 family protein